MKIGELTKGDKYLAKEAARKYIKAKKKKVPDSVRGFIEKNGIVGKTTKEIDALVQQAEKLADSIDPKTGATIPGEILGEGDKFKRWCEKRGRDLPPDDLVRFMNADPFGAKEEIRRRIPDTPKLWRAYCTYLAGAGR